MSGKPHQVTWTAPIDGDSNLVFFQAYQVAKPSVTASSGVLPYSQE